MPSNPFRSLVRKLFFAGLLLAPAVSVRADGKELHVSAAASLADALKEIDAAFTKETGVKVALNLGASSTLARQIEEGAPADVFFSADNAKMDALAAKGLVREETREDQLGNALVIVVPSDSTLKIKEAADLKGEKVRRIATGDPKAVPVGVYAKTYLEKTGLWKDVRPKIVATENVRTALAAVESGNVEAGIVYKTDAAISKKVKVACEVPALPDQKITYPMAALKASTQPELAAKYLDYLDTEASKATFKKFGFTVLPEAPGKTSAGK